MQIPLDLICFGAVPLWIPTLVLHEPIFRIHTLHVTVDYRLPEYTDPKTGVWRAANFRALFCIVLSLF